MASFIWHSIFRGLFLDNPGMILDRNLLVIEN